MNKLDEIARIGNRVAAWISVVTAVVFLFLSNDVQPWHLRNLYTTVSLTLLYVSGMWMAASYFDKDEIGDMDFVVIILAWPVIGPLAIVVVFITRISQWRGWWR